MKGSTLLTKLIDAIWGGFERPPDDAGQLLAIAAWMDRIDDIADEHVNGAVGRTMQDDLRRIAAGLPR